MLIISIVHTFYVKQIYVYPSADSAFQNITLFFSFQLTMCSQSKIREFKKVRCTCAVDRGAAAIWYMRAHLLVERSQKPLKNLAFVMLKNTALQKHFKCKVLIKMVAEILQLQYFKEDGLRDITNVMIHNWDIETSLQHNWNLLCYQGTWILPITVRD